MEQAVRPCLRCDALVEASNHYCPQCGAYLGVVRLVAPRNSRERKDLAEPGGVSAFLALLGLAASVAALCVVAAAVLSI